MYRTLLGVSKEFVHIVKAMEQRESTAPCSLRDLVSSFSRSLCDLVSTQPAAAGSIVEARMGSNVKVPHLAKM